MTYISVLPKNEHSQSRMFEDRDAVMDLLYCAARDVLQISDTDIIVELNRWTTVAFNQAAMHSGAVPDVVVQIATSDRYLQPRFAALCERVVVGWNDHFRDVRLEIWVSLIDTWGANAGV